MEGRRGVARLNAREEEMCDVATVMNGNRWQGRVQEEESKSEGG
jgi:hypothetical protein